MTSLDNSLSFENLKSKEFEIPDFVSAALGPAINSHTDDYRARIFTPEVTAICMINQALNAESQTEAVSRLNSQRIAQGLPNISPSSASYSDAIKRLPVEVFTEVNEVLSKDTEACVDDKFRWHGLNVKAIDGSTLTMEDTAANQKDFPQHGQQDKGVGFPIARIVTLQSLTTGMVEGFEWGPFQGKGTGEMTLAQPLLNQLTEGDVLLGDRYYPSYVFMAKLIDRGVQGVFQSQAQRDIDFREGEQLDQLDHLVKWEKPAQKPSWMSSEEYESLPDTITVREVEVGKQLGLKERFVIVTTLTDHLEFTKEELCNLYKRRWEIESCLKVLKDDMELAHVSAKTPESVYKKIWSSIVAYNFIRWYMLNVSLLAKRSVREISFLVTMRSLLDNSNSILAAKTKEELSRVRAAIIDQILRKKVYLRPGRKEPRAVKKKRKAS